MSIFFTKAKEQIIIYWLLGFYALVFSLSALASCALASLIGTDWKSMDKQGHLEIYLSVFVNWSTIMLAFFNKSASRLAANQLPIAPDDSQLITASSTKKTETVSLEVTATNPPVESGTK